MKTIRFVCVVAAILVGGCAKKPSDVTPVAQFDGHSWHCPSPWNVYGVEERAANGQEPVAVCVK
jgi:hypothetical protein